MSTKLNRTFGNGFVVRADKIVLSALEDYFTVAKWFAESNDAEHQEVCNALYREFCKASNKGTLAMQYLAHHKA